MASKTVNTRIQLKSDTEAHWNQSALIQDGGTKTTGTTFVPLAGELIIYSPDNGSPAYCRLKVGDGIHSVPQLEFIDAGTIGGKILEPLLVEKVNKYDFPAIGYDDKLYIDLSTQTIYCYHPTNGFTQLSHFVYSATTTNIPIISKWDAGKMTKASIDGTSLAIENGREPELEFKSGGLDVVTSIQ